MNPELAGIVSNELGNPLLYYIGATGVTVALMGMVKWLPQVWGGIYPG